MKCPECRAKGVKSTVSVLGTSVTLLSYTPYYDAEGVFHRHDPNTQTSGYRCSNGHHWSEKSLSPCPAGDYPDKEEPEEALEEGG
jgi:hypothetical protein